MTNAVEHKRILLSAVGTNAPRETIYELGNERGTHRFSSLALWDLSPVDLRAREIWMLITPETEKHWPTIEGDAKKLDVHVKRINIAGNEQPDDVKIFLDKVGDCIPPETRLTLDITQGLRHHAFLFYALALYLSTFRNVAIEGVWYCRWEVSRDGHVPRPFLDLKPILELSHWFHALAVFREQGLSTLMSSMIQRTVKRLRSDARRQQNDPSIHRRASESQQLVDVLNKYAFAHAAALPLELGKASCLMIEKIRELPNTEVARNLPLADSLVDAVIEAAKSTKLNDRPSPKGKWKTKIVLNREELYRQSRMIDAYFERGQISLAIGLMREWVISWAMCKEGRTEKWLRYSARKPYEQRLGSLGALCRLQPQPIKLTEQQKQFGEFWNRVSQELRNAFMHYGMREDAIEDSPETVKNIQPFWESLKNDKIKWPGFGGGGGSLLICPIGLTPGSLFSALSHIQPARVLVICSEQSQAAIDDAVEKAGVRTKVQRLVMHDPYAGADEFDSLVADASVWLIESDNICANLTGGTALMGALVGRLAQRARHEYQRPVRELVLIDKRDPQAQRDDPWQLGNIYYLDGDGDERTESKGTQ